MGAPNVNVTLFGDLAGEHRVALAGSPAHFCFVIDPLLPSLDQLLQIKVSFCEAGALQGDKFQSSNAVQV